MNQEIYPYLENIINLDGEKLFGKKEFFRELEIFTEVKKWAIQFKRLGAEFDSDVEPDFKIIKDFFKLSSYFFKKSSGSVDEATKHNFLKDYAEKRDTIRLNIISLLFQAFEKIDLEPLKIKLEQEAKTLADELKQEAKTLADELKTEVNSLRAARATENLSTHFSDYAKKIGEEIEGKKKDSGWSKLQSITFPIGIKGKIRVLRIFNYAIPVIFVVYVILLTKLNDSAIINLEKENLIELAIFFSVTMSLLFSHLKSATRDLNILKNSKESYEHRAKVAETFIAFLASESTKSEKDKDETTKSEMAKQAAIAMFQRVPSGYLTKDQIEPISHPLMEILLKERK